jgi:hypothetical protein
MRIGFRGSTFNLAQFKRISIPVIRRIFGHCEKNIRGSADQQPFNHVAEDIMLYSPQIDGHSMHNLDYEAAYCADVAKRLAERVDDLAGSQNLILHCISVENMGMARVFKINYGLE